MEAQKPTYTLRLPAELRVALAAWAFFSEYPELNAANLELFIVRFGPWAVVVYILAYAVSSPIPLISPILTMAGGLLFGPLLGAVLSTGSAVLTSLIPFTIARRLGREWVEAKLHGSKLEGTIRRLDNGSGFNFVLLLRLVPVIPWEMQNYISGVRRVTVPAYLLATVLGSTPMSVALVLLGAAAKNPASWQFVAALILVGVVFVTPLTILWLRRRGQRKSDI